MKTSEKKLENYQTEITVEYEAADLEKAKKQGAQKLSERVAIPGFRKGKKIPPQILEANLGKGAILEEAADLLIKKAADELVNEEKIIPVTQMKHKIITCEDGKPFTFTLTFTPYPEVKLGEYKNLSVERTVEPVSDDDIEDQLNHLREHHATLTDAEEGDTVQSGDFITLDFNGAALSESFTDAAAADTPFADKITSAKAGDKLIFHDEDKTYAVTVKKAKKVDYEVYTPFEGGAGTDYPLDIGSHKFIDTFEDQLVGAKTGEEVNVRVTFPEDYHVADLADKPAIFRCVVHSIKHKTLPELDDEFAKKASKFETLEEFRADIKKNMTAAAERRATEKQHEDIIELAANNMTVDIPPVMIDSKIDQLIAELELNLQQRGMTLAQYMSLSGLDMDALRDSYKDAATKATRTDILLDEVSRVENIRADNTELNMELQYMAALYRTTPKQIYKVLTENNQISSLISNVLHRKVFKFIIDNSTAAETPAETAETPAENTETAADSDTAKD
ncbi:MAG: trigger factor [Selenomonadaceae bacterium]|nr:trigger factor [Selenomonadaceae bacterium]